MTDESPAIDEQVQPLLAAIRSDDAEGIAAALAHLAELQGTAATSTVVSALNANGLTEAMLAIMGKQSQELNTALAWSQLAMAAAAVGRDELTIEAANTALRLDPATAGAAMLLIATANRRSDYEAALRAITDLVSHVPDAKGDPFIIFQTAVAELGRQEPKAALAAVDSALPRLIAAGLGYDAHTLRAKALEAMPERSTEVVGAWERALAAASHPTQVDRTRDNLIAALMRAKRFDESLREIDKGLAATTNAEARAAWLEGRLNVLVVQGDFDGAIAACEDRLAVTTDVGQRLQLRLRQARVAALASRWKEAATRFDAALAEIAPNAPDASERRGEVLLEKAGTLAPHDIASVLSNLDQLDATWELPGWPLPIDMRIGGLLAAGRAEEAFVWLEERLNRTPALASHPAAHQLRGDAEIKLGYTEEAMQCYARAVVAAPAFGDIRAWGARLASAVPTQQWKAAANAYDQIGQLDPNSASRPDVRVFAAMAYVRLGEFKRGLELTEEPHPSDPAVRMVRDQTRAEAQLRLEEFDGALATTKDALKRYQEAQPGEVPAESLVALHALRAQVFNARKEFALARDAATAAIEVPDDPGVALKGLGEFVRIGALMQRSVALYRLKKQMEAHRDVMEAQRYGTEAHRDVNAAIDRFEQLRNSTILKVMEGAPDFDRFETSLWYAKGAILHDDNRNEEAFAAYTRAERLEKHGNAAAVGQGYALAQCGLFAKALAAFESALTRASSPQERADARAGKGRALIGLEKFDEAIIALQAALDARLTEQDSDPGVFELLGIAYVALKRNRAAARAFRRAWALTAEDKRSANLARGVTAAELSPPRDPTAALNFLDALPQELKDDRTLLFNRALALNAMGKRSAAIGCLLKATDAGLDRAQEELDRLDAPAGLGRWTNYWFGAQARQPRRAGGKVLLVIAATGLAAPLFQWSVHGHLDWYLLLLPSAVAVVLFALPNMKSIGVEAAGLKLSAEPMSATGREAALATAPESFDAPMLIR